ncbi:40S ribosomal protein S2-like [Peromyscus leucopus]|uniref:40S ribosomal protein S2-like n=1 Tax=Peromyscus leucopus TaxID=10041 RepID=UPI0010A1A7A5|nr:40S ribosomal protein S2-like [Peromyscus leucopus]
MLNSYCCCSRKSHCGGQARRIQPGLGGCRGFQGGSSFGLNGHGRSVALVEAAGFMEESKILTFFLDTSLKDEVLKDHASAEGPAFAPIGDYNGHVGLGIKCSKEVATAVREVIILAKLSIVPMLRGYWGNKIGQPRQRHCHHLYFCTQEATDDGLYNDYTSARGCTAILGNFIKATFDAISETFSFLTPQPLERDCHWIPAPRRAKQECFLTEVISVFSPVLKRDTKRTLGSPPLQEKA